jgi:flagellar basal-body rod modification protein FlgD
MSRIPSALSTTDRSFASPDAINDIDLGMFLKLMIAELQNQDPLNPLDNKDMLAQITQIREVGATDRLTETLDSVLLGQSIASATNLIGADITALSDDNQRVEGVVKHVTIDKGVPKLHVEQETLADTSSIEGNIEAGKYSYRVVWENDEGKLFGIELSGDKAVQTTGTPGIDQSIILRNLPATPGYPKQIYRTDHSGKGEYQLVGVVNDGTQSSFIDSLSDEERSQTRQTREFLPSTQALRKYNVSLNNIAGIRPPGVDTDTPTEPLSAEEPNRPNYGPAPRPSFTES